MLPFLIEDLDAVVPAVGDKHTTPRIDGNRMNGPELAGRISGLAPRLDELAIFRELHDAVVVVHAVTVAHEDVAIGGNPKDFKLFDLARRHFGARARIDFAGEPTAALKRAADNPQSWVAVTPWPAAPSVGSWCPAPTEQRYNKLHIIAALPVLREADDQGPKAAVFAASPPEEAGEDVTIVMAFDRNHRLQRALTDSGLTGREIARGDPKVMIRLEGFLAPDDPRVGSLTRYGLDSVRVLGSYARI